MKVKELIKMLQKHDPDKKIMFLRDKEIYTFDLDYLDTITSEQKYLNNIVVIHIKEELSEYDDKIKRIDEILDNFKEYISNSPQENGIKPTYISIKYLREKLKKERDNLEFSKATQGAFDWCDVSKNLIEVDEDKKQKIINLLNELGIKDFSCLTKGEIHFLNLTDSQVKKLLEAQSNEYKYDFVLLGIRKHPNTPMHHYLQLKNGGKDK